MLRYILIWAALVALSVATFAGEVAQRISSLSLAG